MEWLINLNSENVISLILFIVGVVFSVINFFRTGRLNNSAKNFIKENFEKMKTRDTSKYSQNFSETIDDYTLNSVTNELEKSPIPLNVQKKIQSYVDTCLERVLDALLHPDEVDVGVETVEDVVARRNSFMEDLSYAGQMFEMAEDYRERFNLSPDMSVSDVFDYVQKQADELGVMLENMSKGDVNNETSEEIK